VATVFTKKEKQIVWFIGAAFAISWVLPILSSDKSEYIWGWNGAHLAIMQFAEGIEDLFLSSRNKPILDGIELVFRGSGNLLFIASLYSSSQR